jgi:succinoglycan biosynthesis protein ExoV
MKLFYYQDDNGNFGDDLNPWLWPSLLPNILDNDESELFVGIGTLLNHKLPELPIKHIFGAGFGYGQPPKVDKNWNIIAVRGPLTAQALKIDKEKVITDSAILIADKVDAINNQNGDIGFMPHYASCRLADWENIAEKCNLRFISPEWSVNTVLHELKQCSVLLTEAMHGAIVADALRLPWHPLILDNHVNTHKWNDWLRTINIDYEPTRIQSFYNAERGLDLKQKGKNELKRQLISLGFGKDWHQPPPRKSNKKLRDKACQQLSEIVSQSVGVLSDDRIHQSLLKKYLLEVEKFNEKFS